MAEQKKGNFKYVIFLSVVGAIGGFLFGYDTAVISGTIQQVTYLYMLNDVETGWYVGCALIGSIIGVSFAGIISDRLGRRLSLWVAAALFTVSAFGCMVASDFYMLVFARMLGGMGIGVASIVSPLYISEVSPSRYRGTLVTLYQLAVTVGIVASYIVNARVLHWSQTITFDQQWLNFVLKEQPWRGMLGMQTIPAALFFLVLFLIPESPRWQIARNKVDKAVKTMTTLFGESEAKLQIKETQDMLSSEEKTDWRILFKPGYRIALFIGVCLAILGQFMGVNAIFYYGPIIFSEAGMEAQGSLDFQIIVGIVNVLSTILGMYLVDRIGRKKLVYIGVSGMFVMLIAIGIFFNIGINNPVVLLGMIMTYIFFSAISISVVIWVLLSEMYPVKVRGVAMSCAGFSLWIGTYLIGQLTPVLLNGVGASVTFWIFACMCIPYIAITYFLVPETTGKSLEEIEKMWQTKEKQTK
ncbi:sugar porter (SP) family MFS transporter [Dysgonomonas hofstadii]|uniref:Sugar porter (SP) family MFS transporter n=1 Tax=Dysgonomonas hofstadii TaxID=637886 RepID=A0A840CRH4_9BACT|nr:sugar porter family MFS transporter [Dysgonomonas hofstadii]MBB4038026.1 sugar porter (SP) family MFS transporter [Dysgonomonas hofstadii]